MIDFAKVNNQEDFKTYINSVNVKVVFLSVLIFVPHFVMFILIAG